MSIGFFALSAKSISTYNYRALPRLKKCNQHIYLGFFAMYGIENIYTTVREKVGKFYNYM